MTVKELITQLLNHDMDKEIYISDYVGFKNEFGDWVKRSMYDIENIEEGNNVYLNFDNRNHRLKEVKNGEELFRAADGSLMIYKGGTQHDGLKSAMGNWTPVSERLPEENGRYFVTVKLGYVTTAMWVGIAEDWNEVTAWMPFFPKPYKASPTGAERSDK